MIPKKGKTIAFPEFQSLGVNREDSRQVREGEQAFFRGGVQEVVIHARVPQTDGVKHVYGRNARPFPDHGPVRGGGAVAASG
jgi:hypothetical protein